MISFIFATYNRWNKGSEDSTNFIKIVTDGILSPSVTDKLGVLFISWKRARGRILLVSRCKTSLIPPLNEKRRCKLQWKFYENNFHRRKEWLKKTRRIYACFVVCFVHVFAFSRLQLIINEKHCLHYFNWEYLLSCQTECVIRQFSHQKFCPFFCCKSIIES